MHTSAIYGWLNKIKNTNPNQQVDLTASGEHECCTGVIVVLGDRVKVYLDERLELEGETEIILQLTVQIFLKPCKQCWLTSFKLSTSNFSTAEKNIRQENNYEKDRKKKSKFTTQDTLRFIPSSIFASARFVMWKKPSFTTRNTWCIPVEKGIFLRK